MSEKTELPTLITDVTLKCRGCGEERVATFSVVPTIAPANDGTLLISIPLRALQEKFDGWYVNAVTEGEVVGGATLTTVAICKRCTCAACDGEGLTDDRGYSLRHGQPFFSTQTCTGCQGTRLVKN